MANVLGVVWIVIGYAVMNTAILVWAALMLPNQVARAGQRLQWQPVASFFLGVVFWGVTVVVAGALVSHGKQGVVQLLGWLLAGPALAGSVIGGAAVSQIAASRIRGQMRNDSPILALTGGALCTTLACLLPVIGWFVFLPLVGFMSIGAGVLGLFSKKEVAAQPQPAVSPYTVPHAYAPTPQPYPAQPYAGNAYVDPQNYSDPQPV